jgi:hypothetical protein
MFDHKGVLSWSRRSIGVVGSVFEVMAQVDLGLTSVSRFDSADSVLSSKDANPKTWGVTAYPLNKNLVPRFDNKIRAIPSIMTRVTKGERHLHLHFCDIGDLDGTKGTRCILYYLIAIHEEAGDECAHEHLIADRFRLRYRGTSTPASSEATRTLPRTGSWCQRGSSPSSRLLPSFSLTSSMKTEKQFARRGTKQMGETGL